MIDLAVPPRLELGDCIGIIAPSSAIRDDRFARGVKAIEQRGYSVKIGNHVFDKHSFCAGTARSRAQDLESMYADPKIHGIICARGGYSAWQMIDLIDWDIVKRNPKVFVGFSDVTSLHLAIHRFAGFVTFHGPMVTTIGGGLSELSSDSLWRLIESPEPFGTINYSTSNVRTLFPGVAVGPIAGGCISILAANCGTRCQPDFAGCIVCLEDVGELIVHANRHLHQLLRAARLDQAAGFVIGDITDFRKSDSDDRGYGPEDLWREIFEPFGKPAIVGFPFGHVTNPLTLPLGCRARPDADGGTLEIFEQAVQ